MSAQQEKHPFDFKTQYGLGFSTQDDEIVVDFFCGGAGTGLEMGLGRAVNVAKNYSAAAISMHTVNHPDAVPALKLRWVGEEVQREDIAQEFKTVLQEKNRHQRGAIFGRVRSKIKDKAGKPA